MCFCKTFWVILLQAALIDFMKANLCVLRKMLNIPISKNHLFSSLGKSEG